MGYAYSCWDWEPSRVVEKYSNDPSNHDGMDSWVDTEVRDGTGWELPWPEDGHCSRNACCYQAPCRRGNFRRSTHCSRSLGGRGTGCRDRAYHLHDDIPCADEEEGTAHKDDSTEAPWLDKNGRNEEEADDCTDARTFHDWDRMKDVPRASFLRNLDSSFWWQIVDLRFQTKIYGWSGCPKRTAFRT